MSGGPDVVEPSAAFSSEPSSAALSLVGAIGLLAVTLVVARRGEGPMARSLARMTGLLAIYKTIEYASHDGSYGLDALELAAATLAVIPASQFVASVLEARRTLRWPLVLVGILAGSLATLMTVDAAFGPGSPPLERFALPFLALLLLTFVPAGFGLVRATLRARGAARSRLGLVLGCLALIVGGGATDLAAATGLPVPKVSDHALLLGTPLLAVLALRSSVPAEGQLRWVRSLLIAAFAVLGTFALSVSLGDRAAVMVVGVVTTCVFGVWAARPRLARDADRRARTAYLTSMGRLAEGVAESLRAPLSRAYSSAELLRDELRQGRSLTGRMAYIEALLTDLAFLEESLDTFERVARCEPRPEPFDIGRVLEELKDDRELGPLHFEVDLPIVVADRDMTKSAVEQLIANARQASRPASAIHVRVRSATEGVEIEVEDHGSGMTPSASEAAPDDFVTTRRNQFGLGLGYVRRVANAHGGRLDIDSQPGIGTRVTMSLRSSNLRS